MLNLRRHMLLGLASLTLGACGGTTDGPSADGGAPFDAASEGDGAPGEPAGFASQLTRALCENLFECRLAYDDASQLRAGLGSVERCEQALAERVGDGESTLFGRSVSGLRFQEVQAEACLARFPHQCFAFEAEEPEDSLRTICAEVFEGSLAQGELCRDDLECAGDAYCDQSEGLACDMGRCAPRRGKGEPCESGNECTALGLAAVLCEGADSATLSCVHVQEIARVGEGELCGRLAVSEHELSFALCDGALVCDREQAGSEVYRCVAPLPLGSSCSDEREECVTGAVCLPESPGASTSVCGTFAIVAEGDGCTPREQFSAESLRVCERGLWCGESLRCEPLSPAGEGESCADRECADGLRCSYDFEADAEFCIRLRTVGERCDSPSDCESDTCEFDGTEGMCAPNPCQ